MTNAQVGIIEEERRYRGRGKGTTSELGVLKKVGSTNYGTSPCSVFGSLSECGHGEDGLDTLRQPT